MSSKSTSLSIFIQNGRVYGRSAFISFTGNGLWRTCFLLWKNMSGGFVQSDESAEKHGLTILSGQRKKLIIILLIYRILHTREKQVLY